MKGENISKYTQLEEGHLSLFRGELDANNIYRARRGQSKLWILTTTGSYKSRVKAILTADKKDVVKYHNDYVPMFSTAITDEFHTIKGRTTEAIGFLKNLPGRLRHLMLSGTPLEKGLNDILGPLEVMQEHWFDRWVNEDEETGEKEQNWAWTDGATAHKGFLDPLRVANLQKQASITENHVKRKKTLTVDERKQFDDALDTTRDVLHKYMISRTPRSKWFGEPAVAIPPHEHWDVDVLMPPSLITALDDIYQVADNQLFDDMAERVAKYRAAVQEKRKGVV